MASFRLFSIFVIFMCTYVCRGSDTPPIKGQKAQEQLPTGDQQPQPHFPHDGMDLFDGNDQGYPPGYQPVGGHHGAPHHGHHGNHQRYRYPLTCRCGVQGGAESPFKAALISWANTYYSRSSDYGGDSSPMSNTCIGTACYRADFVGVRENNMGDYGSQSNWHHDNNHYTVYGCTEPGSMGPSSLEYKMQQNVSLEMFMSTHYKGWGYARFVLELQCTHHRCQNFNAVPWQPTDYYWKLLECSSSGYKNKGYIGLVLAFVSIIFMQNSA